MKIKNKISFYKTNAREMTKYVYTKIFNNIIFKFIIKKIIWDLSGLRFIWSKINPPIMNIKETRPPSTIFIWIIGVYTAFFGIASQRYENRIDIIETRANAVYTQLTSPISAKVFSRFSKIQNMTCPQKPNILDPKSVFKSLFADDLRYFEMVNLIKETVEDWKNNLENSNLSNIDLTNCNLEGANLRNCDLSNSNLKGAKLINADLSKANLYKSNISEAYLQNAKLDGAVLQNAKLNMTWIDYNQLVSVKSLVDVQMKGNNHLLTRLKQNHPELFILPPPSPVEMIRIFD